mmetsp:Transcript_57437/g.124243  ORF Transcript_57437/g.124243 Transcript_57437/m.124243 type:complete len:105 (+) Transcript_57437:133-447(+)
MLEQQHRSQDTSDQVVRGFDSAQVACGSIPAISASTLLGLGGGGVVTRLCLAARSSPGAGCATQAAEEGPKPATCGSCNTACSFNTACREGTGSSARCEIGCRA